MSKAPRRLTATFEVSMGGVVHTYLGGTGLAAFAPMSIALMICDRSHGVLDQPGQRLER